MSFMWKQPSALENYQGVYVIPVIGPKASGKSSFINQLLGEEVMVVGHELDSGTIDVTSVEVKAEIMKRNIPLWNSKVAKLVIVDTPGYDDDITADNTGTIQNLKEIPRLLANKYGAGWKLAGVIYLHDISLPRGTGAAKSFFRAFDKLWDEGARKFIVVGTTQWTRILAADGRIAKCREQDLRKVWKDAGGKGWIVQRVDDENNSPWMLVETVLLKNMSSTFRERSTRARFEKLQGDYIIPVMGPTGAGKSSFINQLLEREAVKVGQGLKSCTTQLQAVEVPADIVDNKLLRWALGSEKKLVVVDTPGFDDTSADDSEILHRVAKWLADSYGAGARLAGIIYLQEITQARVTGATKRNFEVFDKLCGKDASKSVVLGTTKWMNVPADRRTITEEKEQQLRTRYWKDMMARGSTMHRVDDKETNASPWDLVQTILLNRESPTLLIQRELVEMNKSLPRTEAAQVLRERIEELIKLSKRDGVSEEDIRALTQEVAALKEKSIFTRFFGRLFG